MLPIKTTKRILASIAIAATLGGSAAVVTPPIKTSHPHHSAASWSSKASRKV